MNTVVLEVRPLSALLDAGVMRRIEDGRVEFPFEVIKVEFELRAA